MLRRIFGTEKLASEGGVPPNPKGLDVTNRTSEPNDHSTSRTEELKLEAAFSSTQSLPDLTINGAAGQAEETGNANRAQGNPIEDIRINWPKESLESVNVSVCSDPLAGQVQSNLDPRYRSAENLLKVEIKRDSSARRVFSVKKSKHRPVEDSSSKITGSSKSLNVVPLPVQANDLTRVTASDAQNLEEEQNGKTESHLSLDVPAAYSGSNSDLLGLPEVSANSKYAKRSPKKSQKRSRSRTLAGSELLTSLDHFKSAFLESGGIQSDGENSSGAATGRGRTGWRSASVKGSSTGKVTEIAGTPPKSDGLAARTSPTYIPITKLDEYLVLAADSLEENCELHVLKVDVTQDSVQVKPDGLANYLEDKWQFNRSFVSMSSVAILLPSSRNSSYISSEVLSQFVEAEKKLCISKGNVGLSRLHGSWSYGRYMFLTSEYLLIMKQKTTTTFKLKKKAAICDLWLSPGTPQSGEVGNVGPLSFIIGWPLAANYQLMFTKAEQKTMWMHTLEKLIAAERTKDAQREAKIIRISTQDTEYTVTKSLAVNSEETVLQVIQRCVREFHTTESDPKNFELCVRSRDTLTPLLGHEVPFYIQLKNFPSRTEQENQVLRMQTPDLEAFDHFVLRPKKTQQKNGFRRRPRRLTLVGLFVKKSVPPQPDVLQSMPKPQLFGRNLSEICLDDSLPKPIMELLRRLYVQGPITPGIFRKSGNHKDLLELKARLDAGEECSIDDISIHVAASAVKNWLRNLPDCLLLSSLYGQWIDTTSLADNEEKTNSMKKLVLQLPNINVLLLRYLTCILYHISCHAERNHMTSGNLAICLGPSILWPSGAVDLTSECVSVELVARLTQLFVDGAQEILGNECLDLFRELTDEVPAETEINYESDDSLGSQEMLNEKHLEKDASLESLDNYSCDDAVDNHSYSAVQSQTSVDSGLVISNSHLFEDPGPSSNSLAPPDQHRYAKRQLGGKKKAHTKSELSDISEALTIHDLEERPSSKLTGASNVRQRIQRFQTSKLNMDESSHDSGGENLESSEDEYTRASLSSSENFAGGSGSVSRCVSSNNDVNFDGSSREFEESLDSEEDVATESLEIAATFNKSPLLPQKSLRTQVELCPPAQQSREQQNESEDVGKTLLLGDVKKPQALGSSEGMWFFTGPEEVTGAFQKRTLKQNQPKDVPLQKGTTAITVQGDQLDGHSKLSSKSDRRRFHDEPTVKQTKQLSLDSVSGYDTSTTMSAAASREAISPISPRRNAVPGAFCVTSFEVVENASSEHLRHSKIGSSPSPNYSTREFISPDGYISSLRQLRERSATRRLTDIGVNTNDSFFRNSQGVQTDSPDDQHFSTSVDSVRYPGNTANREAVEPVTYSQREDTQISDAARRRSSGVDLTKRRSWHQEFSGHEPLRTFIPQPSRPGQVSERPEIQDQRRSPRRILQRGEQVFAEDLEHLINQSRAMRGSVQKAGYGDEPVNELPRSRQNFNREIPVSIEQRIMDKRSVTVVKIGDDDTSTSSSSYPMLNKPLSIPIPLRQNVLPTARYEPDKRGKTFGATVEVVNKGKHEGPVNVVTPQRNRYLVQNDRSNSACLPSFSSVPVSPVRSDSIHQKPVPHPSAVPQHVKVPLRQVSSLVHSENQGRVFGSQSFDSSNTDSSRSHLESQRQHDLSQHDVSHHRSVQPGKNSQRAPLRVHNTAYENSPKGVDRLDRTPRSVMQRSQTVVSSCSMDIPAYNDNSHIQAHSNNNVNNAFRSNAVKLAESNMRSSSMATDEPSVTWSVNELKKRFDAPVPNTRQPVSKSKPLVKKV